VREQHLSDEAVAAFADGVLTGHARERATRHVESCAECRTAVRVQREAAWALRAAAEPALPSALADRLRSVPMTTALTTLPTVMAPDGSTMLATFAPAAALVADSPAKGARRSRPIITTAAIVALAGALAAGSVARDAEPPAQRGTGTVVHSGIPGQGSSGSGRSGADTVSVFRAHQP
jgi:putative zinc finger protein